MNHTALPAPDGVDWHGCNPSSFLSPKIHHILCSAGVCERDLTQCYLDDAGFLKWTSAHMLLPNEEDTEEYFVQSVTALAPVFQEASQHLQKLTCQDFTALYSYTLQWCSSPKLVEECFTIIQDDVQTGVVLALLLLTSVLERSLGDVFLLKGRHCPNMLKDLLLTPELHDILGIPVIQLLRVLIGPPISLNLRNVVWHGFPVPGEIPPQYGYFLLIVTASIGAKLEEKSIRTQDIPHRAYLTFPHYAQMNAVISDLDSVGDSLEAIFSESKFVASSMQPFWKLALNMYHQGRYGFSLVLLLPQLEHGLRRLFAAVNCCVHHVLTAESSVLFTTMDEIFCACLPNGSRNQLRSILGDNIMDMLFDHFIYMEGPRIRDRVSHGEMEIYMCCPLVAKLSLQLAVLLCVQFLPGDSTLRQTDMVKEILSDSAKYSSTFHPICRLKIQIGEAAASLDRWCTIPRPTQEEIELDVKWENHSDEELVSHSVYITARTLCKPLENGSHGINIPRCVQPFEAICSTLDFLCQKKYSTLYRWADSYAGGATQDTSCVDNNESVLVGIMRRVCSTVQQVSAQVLDVATIRYGQWSRKELRSRQRNTYSRMLDSVPLLSSGLRLVLLYATVHYLTLNNFIQLTKDEQTNTIKSARFVLQYCENLMTYTSLDKNRWEEASSLTSDLCQRITKL